MNRENRRKNSRRILGGMAGSPKIYVGRWGGVAALILRAENWRAKNARWAVSLDLGLQKSDHNSQTSILPGAPASGARSLKPWMLGNCLPQPQLNCSLKSLHHAQAVPALEGTLVEL